ncbi:MAG TPA: MotA/TolQ/ExbB proton channel family protein [Candidatus Eisenbacteria bacterium]|jgi:biopolymer transport protein ExbB|nr:MotA/TolQ/ExbB proton channel family protein [Candidatus Eisenbacteria bacterium]
MFENFDWIGAMRQSPVMVIILVCSVLTFGFALERALYYWKRRGNPDGVMATAVVALRSGNREEALRACATTPHPVGPVATELIRNLDLPADVAEEKLHIALSEQKLLLERNLGFLGTMGNTAPLIGLLGTVWGIMRAFHDMASTGSAGPSVVAAGIAEALFTTAASLVVAVPAVIMYNNFIRRMNVMLTVAENHARQIRLSGHTSSSSSHVTSRAA